MEPVEEKPRKRKEKYAKLAAKLAKETADESSAVHVVPSFAEIAQLKEALERMQKEIAARSQPAQPGTMLYPPGQYGVQTGYGQWTPPSMAPQVVMPIPQRAWILNPSSSTYTSYRNVGPRWANFTPKAWTVGTHESILSEQLHQRDNRQWQVSNLKELCDV